MKRALARIVSAPEADVRPVSWRPRSTKTRKSESQPVPVTAIGPELEAQIQQQARVA